MKVIPKIPEGLSAIEFLVEEAKTARGNARRPNIEELLIQANTFCKELDNQGARLSAIIPVRVYESVPGMIGDTGRDTFIAFVERPIENR